MKPSKPSAIDREVVAENIVYARRSQVLTQVELAEKASVSVPSVFRAEKAQSVRLSTLRKIALGLTIDFDSMLVRKQRGAKIVIHRAADATWHALSDSRPHLPEDYLLRYQDNGERIRLGTLGFVPSFMAPPTSIMKDGPGLVLIEVFDNLEASFNAQFCKDAVIYAVRGSVKAKIGTEIVEVSEGDWVGYPPADLVTLRSAEKPGSPKYPSIVLWIGANRVRKR